MAIGNALAARRVARKRLLPIDPRNPYGVGADGKATCWVTREKVCLLIEDMTNGHIINTINLIERKLEELRYRTADAFGFAGMCRGEMAEYYAGHAAEDAADESLAYELAYRPVLDGLRAEARKRRLVEVLIPFRSDT